MASIWIVEIYRRLPLSHSDLSEQIALAVKAAADASFSLLDCPWNYGTDSWSRACRVVWRVNFRAERARLSEKRKTADARERVPFIFTAEQKAA